MRQGFARCGRFCPIEDVWSNVCFTVLRKGQVETSLDVSRVEHPRQLLVLCGLVLGEATFAHEDGNKEQHRRLDFQYKVNTLPDVVVNLDFDTQHPGLAPCWMDQTLVVKHLLDATFLTTDSPGERRVLVSEWCPQTTFSCEK